MAPRFHPGEYALVEPGTQPEIEDDVLVRLASGETLIKRLLSRRDGYRLGSWNDTAVLQLRPEDVTWMYYIAHPVPTRKIKNRL
jgi:phage repressor protein C with HTH and peptisase S24 domain